MMFKTGLEGKNNVLLKQLNMNKYQAEKIVNSYGAAIARGTDGGIVRRKSLLPCSKARIKQAYFVYIAAIIKEFGGLPKDMGENLVLTYSMLNGFIDDQKADEIIKIERLIKEKKLDSNDPKDKEKMDRYFSYAMRAISDGELFDEINEYIGENSDEQ